MSTDELEKTHAVGPLRGPWGAASGSPRPGEPWGKYRVERLLGEGGMGRVYRAWDPALRRAVALKCLRTDDPVAVERLLMEARAQARVEHEQVCKVYEVGEAEGRPYIAMQLIEGASLRDAAAGMSLEQQVKAVREVAEGVQAAHRTGLIHRDLKPANILVERTEDGGIRPYVVDFGLAREPSAPGLTRTGLMVGTLAYMAPEQVTGDSSRLDRRVDVWALGATLYELLAGRPPFDGASEGEILLRLMQEEPVPLRRLVPSVPADLETVIMKCLERDPARRYDSARALATDLQRFLDGEPVSARPTGWTYRAAKKLRKHRLLAAVVAVSLLAVALLAGLALRAQWRARETAVAAQRFGRQVQEIEGTLRVAYLLPLHDVRPEQRAVRERMRRIEEQMRGIGDIAAGPGHYALGRGALALGRLEEAQRHLETAWRLGHRPPEVAYALGRALGERYQRGLDEAGRIAESGLREAHRRAITRNFLEPARRYLRESRGVEGESPAYLEALLAFYEERHPEALRLAARALRETPSLYEAARLAGEIHWTLAIEARHGGDVDGALRHWAAAGRAYAGALEIARSDPDAHAAECVRQSFPLQVATLRGDPMAPHMPAALAACDRALAVAPDSARVMSTKARTHLWFAQDLRRQGDEAGFLAELRTTEALARRALAADPRHAAAFDRLGMASIYRGEMEMGRGVDPRPWLRRAQANLSRAAELQPGLAFSYWPLGYAWLRTAEYEMSLGLDPRPSLARAAETYRRGLSIDPSIALVHHHLGYTLAQMGAFATTRGEDPRPRLDEAVAAYRKAIEIDPATISAYSNLGNAYTLQAQADLDRGRDPRLTLAKAVESYRRGLELRPDHPASLQNLGAALSMQGLYELQAGLDPRPALAKARDSVRKSLEADPRDPFAYSNLATFALWEADFLLDRDLDPEAALEEGLRRVEQSLALNPNDAEVLNVRADLEIAAARRRLALGAAPEPVLAPVERTIARGLEVNPERAELWSAAADVHRLRAEASFDPPGESIRRGLQAAEKALALKPSLFTATLAAGRLHLIAARASTDPEERRRRAAESVRSLERTLELNPLSRRQVEPLLRQARALAQPS